MIALARGDACSVLYKGSGAQAARLPNASGKELRDSCFNVAVSLETLGVQAATNNKSLVSSPHDA